MPSDPHVPPPSPPAGPPPTVPRFAAPRRLHPASVVVGVNLRQIVQAFLFPAAATFAAGGRVMLTALVLVSIVGLVVRTLAWQRFHYSFDGEVLRVDEGVISRNHRALDVARVQQVEVDRSAVQRLLGLATLRVETAGGSSEVEVELRVVTEDDALALRSALRESKARAVRDPSGAAGDLPDGDLDVDPGRHTVLEVPLRHVVLASVTGVRLLVFPALLTGAFQFAGQNLTEWIERSLEGLVEAGLVGPDGVRAPSLTTGLVLALAVLTLSVVVAIAVGVLRDARFRIERIDDDLHVTRGLLSTRDSVLPLRRIQLVQVHRNWLRRLLGAASVRVHSAGGSADAERRVTVPLLPEAAVTDLMRELYPGAPGVPALAPHPPNAMRRAVFRWLRSVALPIAAVWFLPFAWLDRFEGPVLVLVPVAIVLAVVEYRQLAHGASDRLVAARQGALSVATSVAPLVKVQAVSTRANWFQRRLGLATVRIHVAGPGGDVVVLDAGSDVARQLHARLAVHAADPTAVGPAAEAVRRQPA